MEVSKKIIVLAGPSGVGKSTLTHILLSHFDVFDFSISATTRSLRLGEKNGLDYYFFSKEEFQKRIENEEFVEWEEVYPGRFYGTLKSEVARITGLGKIAIFDIDVLGAITIKEQFGDEAYAIFIKPESTEALKNRLMNRGTENEQEVQVRVSRFEKELSYENKFDAVLVNETNEIEKAKQEIISLVKENALS